MATTMFIRHRVSDFTKWRQVYEEVAPLQQGAGVVREAVYRSAEDPNDVTVMHDFASAEKARAFAASRDLKEAMARAGVIGVPTIWIAAQA
jgi:hypothetical protein